MTHEDLLQLLGVNAPILKGFVDEKDPRILRYPNNLQPAGRLNVVAPFIPDFRPVSGSLEPD